MYEISTSFIPDEPGNKHYRDTYLKHVIKDRNIVMEHYMRKPMREKKTFIAIGALHLYGDQGVLALIEKRRFTRSHAYCLIRSSSLGFLYRSGSLSGTICLLKQCHGMGPAVFSLSNVLTC